MECDYALDWRGLLPSLYIQSICINMSCLLGLAPMAGKFTQDLPALAASAQVPNAAGETVVSRYNPDVSQISSRPSWSVSWTFTLATMAAHVKHV